MLAIYGVNQGPQGYRPLREFPAGKLKADAGIACVADDIRLPSGSSLALDFINGALLAHGDTVIIEGTATNVRSTAYNRRSTFAPGWP